MSPKQCSMGNTFKRAWGSWTRSDSGPFPCQAPSDWHLGTLSPAVPVWLRPVLERQRPLVRGGLMCRPLLRSGEISPSHDLRVHGLVFQAEGRPQRLLWGPLLLFRTFLGKVSSLPRRVAMTVDCSWRAASWQCVEEARDRPEQAWPKTLLLSPPGSWAEQCGKTPGSPKGPH